MMICIKNKLLTCVLLLWIAMLAPQTILHAGSILDEREQRESALAAQGAPPLPCADANFHNALTMPLTDVSAPYAVSRQPFHATTHLLKTSFSFVVWPLDFLKKTSLYVLKSPLLFLTATGALLPHTTAQDFRQPHLQAPYRQTHPQVSFGLTADWDTTMCQGHAIHKNQTQTVQLKKTGCPFVACSHFTPSSPCNEPEARRHLEHYDRVHSTCDDDICAPLSVDKASTTAIDMCIHKVCQQHGRPYTGHFLCKTFGRYADNSLKRHQMENAIFTAEKCFAPFCDNHALHACPHNLTQEATASAPSLPCNNKLCAGRFVLKEDNGIDLEKQGEQAIQQCKEIPAYKITVLKHAAFQQTQNRQGHTRRHAIF